MPLTIAVSLPPLCLSLFRSPCLLCVSFLLLPAPLAPCQCSPLLTPCVASLRPCPSPQDLGCLSPGLLPALPPSRSPPTSQVSPLPLPRGGSTVTPAALQNPATPFPLSVRMMKLVASVLAPQVGLWPSGPNPGRSRLPPALPFLLRLPQQAPFVPQGRARSSSGEAASQEHSAFCPATPPTGHTPTLCGTTAATRTCAMWPSGCSGPPAPSSPPCFSWPALPGEVISSSSLTPICSS